jgi:hypothetical protein
MANTFQFSDTAKIRIIDQDVELANLFKPQAIVWDWQVQINDGEPVDRCTVQEDNIDLAVAIDNFVILQATEAAEDAYLERISRRCSR